MVILALQIVHDGFDSDWSLLAPFTNLEAFNKDPNATIAAALKLVILLLQSFAAGAAVSAAYNIMQIYNYSSQTNSNVIKLDNAFNNAFSITTPPADDAANAALDSKLRSLSANLAQDLPNRFNRLDLALSTEDAAKIKAIIGEWAQGRISELEKQAERAEELSQKLKETQDALAWHVTSIGTTDQILIRIATAFETIGNLKDDIEAFRSDIQNNPFRAPPPSGGQT